MTAPIYICAARSWHAHNKKRECVTERLRAIRIYIHKHPGCTREEIKETFKLSESTMRATMPCVREVRAEIIYPGRTGKRITRFWPAEEK